MENLTGLNRFLEAQKHNYEDAFREIKSGRKSSHWMWFIFPQIAGLGYSEIAKLYAIKNLEEAENYLAHPILGPRLLEITRLLTHHSHKTAHEIFGNPDDLKLKSSMTLFNAVYPTDTVFQQVLDQYFNGLEDQRTLSLINKV